MSKVYGKSISFHHHKRMYYHTRWAFLQYCVSMVIWFNGDDLNNIWNRITSQLPDSAHSNIKIDRFSFSVYITMYNSDWSFRVSILSGLSCKRASHQFLCYRSISGIMVKIDINQSFYRRRLNHIAKSCMLITFLLPFLLINLRNKNVKIFCLHSWEIAKFL